MLENAASGEGATDSDPGPVKTEHTGRAVNRQPLAGLCLSCCREKALAGAGESGLERPCCPAWPGAAGARATWTATDPRKWMSWLPSIPRKCSGEAWEETQHEGPCGCTAATPSPSLHQDQPSPRGDLGLSWELCTHRHPPAPHQQRHPEESRWSHTRQGGTLPSADLLTSLRLLDDSS